MMPSMPKFIPDTQNTMIAEILHVNCMHLVRNDASHNSTRPSSARALYIVTNHLDRMECRWKIMERNSKHCESIP